VLIIDMINDLDFEGAEELAPVALRIAERIAALREAADRSGVPVVYVNDHFGQWHSERSKLVEHCQAAHEDARTLIATAGPREGDYFVIKPMHSGFYSTNLPVLLPKLGASRLILTGIAADICVLFTAADAHMRDYEIWAPEDCLGARTAERTGWALEIMRTAMSARTEAFSDETLQAWIAEA